MAAKRDYYEVLSVRRDASAQEIKSAYRRLAVQYHPDRNPGDGEAEALFKQAAEAYAVLSSPEKRARYDRLGHQGIGGQGFGGFDPTVFGDFADILGDLFGFGDLFGGRRRGQGGEPGADLRYELRLSFEEAAFGTERALEIPRLEVCAECSGSGAAAGTSPQACSACSGRGQVLFSQGFFTVARTCPRCGGEGRLITDPCGGCRGEGRVAQHRTVEVTLPAGVDTGTRLRLAGEGEHGRRGGRTGDLYVVVVVEPHPRLRRDGIHVRSELKISFPQAVLGATVPVETLWGEVAIEVPPATRSGSELRLPDKGIARLDGRGRGDHLVGVEIEVPDPRRLTPEEIEILKRLAEAQGTPVREERTLVDRMRGLFQ